MSILRCVAALLLLLAASAPAQERAQSGAARQPVPPEEVRFKNGDVTLTGLLRLPTGSPQYPAVVLLPGSLPSAKEDERLATVAAAFLARGFAVLTTDSRGTGASQGDFDTASLEVLAADGAAAIATLRRRSDVRADAVGLWGVSQGATWVGPLTASRADAAFLVATSGSLASPETYMHRFFAGRLRRIHGLDESTIERITKARGEVWSYYATGHGYEAARAAVEPLREEPWFASSGLPAVVRAPDELTALPAQTRTFLQQKDFDPLAAIAGMKCPLLIVYGARDSRLPVAEHTEALRALASSPEVTITVDVLPGLDHDLQPVSADAESETGMDAFAVMARWAKEQVNAPRSVVEDHVLQHDERVSTAPGEGRERPK